MLRTGLSLPGQLRAFSLALPWILQCSRHLRCLCCLQSSVLLVFCIWYWCVARVYLYSTSPPSPLSRIPSWWWALLWLIWFLVWVTFIQVLRILQFLQFLQLLLLVNLMFRIQILLCIFLDWILLLLASFFRSWQLLCIVKIDGFLRSSQFHLILVALALGNDWDNFFVNSRKLFNGATREMFLRLIAFGDFDVAVFFSKNFGRFWRFKVSLVKIIRQIGCYGL